MSRFDGDSPSTYAGHPATSEQKNGQLRGGALTAEVLDSADNILKSGKGAPGTLTGLQQWFAPREVYELVGSVIGRSTPTIDLTAGNGQLLKKIDPEYRYGLEIDGDHIPADDSSGRYTAIHGDAQRIVPMMRAIGMGFPGVVLNPPYGLDWHDPVHGEKKVNSTKLAMLWALDVLGGAGQGAILCPTKRLKRELLSDQRIKEAVYAIVNIEGHTWKSVTDECSIAFFVKPTNVNPRRRDPQAPAAEFNAPLDDIANYRYEIETERSRYSYYVHPSSYSNHSLAEQFRALRTEYQRRLASREARRKSSTPEYDLSLSGNKIHAYMSPYAKLRLAKAGIHTEIRLLDRSHIAYFGQNKRSWKTVLQAEEDGHLTISPRLRAAAEATVEESDRLSTPLFPVKPQMRLGWLTDLEQIECRKSDPDKQIVAGESYRLYTQSVVQTQMEQRPHETRDGKIKIRKFQIERRVLKITIHPPNAKPLELSESPDDMKYIEEHFVLPNPGSVKETFPETYAENTKLLTQLEEENGFTLKPFQKDHLARLLVKKRGLLAHEQGLGKTLQLMVLAKASTMLKGDPAEDKVLFVVPQDLIPQWQREATKFFGRKIEVIKNAEQAHKVKTRLDAGGTGWFITYFEALSIVGRKHVKLPEVPLNPATALKLRLADYRKAKAHKKIHGVDPDVGSKDTYDKERFTDEEGNSLFGTTRHACPRCLTDTAEGWDREVCAKCKYVHRALKLKPAYTHLTRCFSKGVICVDEISEIRGDDSLRSKCIRALSKGRFKWGATGTPVSNFVNDSFWALWWCLGNASIAFPYDYNGGKTKFEQDFCVIEYMMGDEKKFQDHVRQRRKVLPKVTNVSQFWRLVQPGVSRCRKEHTGEPLVKRTLHPTFVPMGVAQAQHHKFWMYEFPRYFSWKDPHHPLVEMGLVDKYAATLGQLWRLEHSATMPDSDQPTKEWPVAQAQEWVDDLSNWTPANLKVLELAIQHVKQGEKVLIGSDLIATGKWLSDRLEEKGVRSVHITEEKTGKDGPTVSTKNPRSRAKEVEAFVSGDAQVLCAGVNAMKLGHNLDVASVVIVNGLPYSHMVMDQFIARVHRLTSKREVQVYVIIPNGSLAQTKWNLLKDKGAAADLAFDGELAEQLEKPVDWNKILQKMKETGFKTSGDEVAERDVYEKGWVPIPRIPYVSTQGRTDPSEDKDEARTAEGTNGTHFKTTKRELSPDEYAPPVKLPAQKRREDKQAEREAKRKEKNANRKPLPDKNPEYEMLSLF